MVQELIIKEIERQQNTLGLIPSENIVSENILSVLGTPLTNKYSEGYPTKRYYGGNKVIDEIEMLAIIRAKKLFKTAFHVNVQPYSGTPANLAVYNAILKPKDKILSMELSHGGHLTHGSPLSFASRIYKFFHYPVNPKTHLIDYDLISALVKKHKPKLIISGASSYPRTIDFKHIAEIATKNDCYSMSDISHIAGLIVTKQHNTPFPKTDFVTTTTHKTLRGPRGAIIFCKKEFSNFIDKSVFPGVQGGPHNNVIAAKTVCFEEAMSPEFFSYGAQIVRNAKALAEVLLAQGFNLITGGTDNHLLLIDLRNKNIFGGQAEKVLESAGIVVNKNLIPYDKRKPLDPSGIRVGTPLLTSRGMKESEMKHVGFLISQVLHNYENNFFIERIREEVKELTRHFPIYEGFI